MDGKERSASHGITMAARQVGAWSLTVWAPRFSVRASRPVLGFSSREPSRVGRAREMPPWVGYEGVADLALVPLACAAWSSDPPVNVSRELPLGTSAEAVAVDLVGCAPSGGKPGGVLRPAQPSTSCRRAKPRHGHRRCEGA